MNKIILGSALAFAALTMTSCLHDNKELFDEPAANRIEDAVKADKALLESATNGWEMHYFTGEDYTGGGYTMYMKFKNGKASVSSDIAPADMVTTSSYDVIKDRGPVLTFNTYNMIMHYLAQPYQSDVDGEQGDYEFVITKTTQDSIYVKGKKWGNRFVMTRVPEDQSWKENITKIQSIVASMRFAYMPEGAVESDDAVLFDPSTRRMYTALNKSTGTAYYITPTGITFQEPVKIMDNEVSELTFDPTTLNFASADGSVKLDNYTPEGFKSLNSFLGSWNMSYEEFDSQTGSYSPQVQTFTFSPMTDLIQQQSQTAVYGQFSIGSYNFATQFTYSPTGGYLYLQSYMFQSPLSQFYAMAIVPGYTEVDPSDGNTHYHLANGNVNFMPREDGNCDVTFDDEKATMMLMLGINTSGEIDGIVYAWDNPADFVAAAAGAKKMNANFNDFKKYKLKLK